MGMNTVVPADKHGQPVKPPIDAGLDLLVNFNRPRPHSLREIAIVCRCSHVTIGRIERQAMSKLRERIEA